MDPHALDGYQRLTAIAPLAERRDALPAPWRRAHREILAAFASSGHPPARRDLVNADWLEDADALLERLTRDDLVVLDDAGEIAGAYPFTTEPTAHRVALGPVDVHAMCAVDALAVAPMLGSATVVTSICAVTGRPVAVRMRGTRLLESAPGTACVGIHWAHTGEHTAHALCRGMLFFADDTVAARWQAEAPAPRRIYSLAQAVAIGAAFFGPLMP